MRVLVTGATGFVGGRLVPALLDAGHEVAALVRDADRYDGPDAVDVYEGDLLERSGYAAAFEGVDAAYYLVHSMGSGEAFEERDRRAASNFANAASAGDVDRVVYLSGLGSESDELSAHLRSRREVETVLREGDYEVTVLRAAILVGVGSAGFEIAYQLAARLPVMTTPRWVRTPCQPIAAGDAVAYLVGVLDAPETAGEVYEIGGPDVTTYQGLLERTADAIGTSPLVLPVPVLSPGLSAYWVDLVTDVPRSVAHPLIHGLKNPVLADDGPIREHVAPDLTPIGDAIDRAVADHPPLDAPWWWPW